MSRRKSRKDSRGAEHALRPEADPRPALDVVSRWSRPVCLFGAAGLLVATPLVPSESAAAKGTGIGFVMLWLALLAVWLLAALSQPRFTLRFGWVDGALLLIVACHFMSGLVMAWQGNPRSTFNMIWQWVGFGISFFVMRQIVRTPAEVRAFHALMIALAVALSALAYFQYGYTLPVNQAEYKRLAEPERTEWLFRNAGVVAPEGSRERTMFENRLNSREPMATFALTNSLAAFLAPWLAAAVGIFVANLPFQREKLRTLLTLLLTILFVAGCLLLTKSRTSFVALAVGVVLVALYCRAHGRRLPWQLPAVAGGLLVLLVLGAILVGGLDMAVLAQAPKTVLYRIEYWQATSALIWEHPLFGVGPGNFQEYYNSHKLPQASESIADPHNFLFEIWATAGTPALLALVAFLVGLASKFSRAARSDDELQAPVAFAQAIHTTATLFGGLAGLIFSFLYTLLFGFPQETWELVRGLPIPVLWLVGLPAAAIVTWLLLPWIESGRLPLAVTVSALVVLLINLLAAGGIGFPGVSGTLWLLAALGLSSVPGEERSVPRFGAVALLMVAFALIFGCHTSAYQPLLTSAVELDRGKELLSEQRYEQAESAIVAAAAADPYAADPWEMIVTFALIKWQFTQTPERLEQLDSAIRELLSRDRQSNSRRLQAGDWYLAAFRHTHDPAIIERSIEAYRAAVERYPSNNLAYAKLAWAYALYRDGEKARLAAAEALRLDQITPHEDKKLRHVTNLSFDPGPRGKLPNGVPDKPAEKNLEQLVRRLAAAP